MRCSTLFAVARACCSFCTLPYQPANADAVAQCCNSDTNFCAHNIRFLCKADAPCCSRQLRNAAAIPCFANRATARSTIERRRKCSSTWKVHASRACDRSTWLILISARWTIFLTRRIFAVLDFHAFIAEKSPIFAKPFTDLLRASASRISLTAVVFQFTNVTYKRLPASEAPIVARILFSFFLLSMAAHQPANAVLLP